MSESVVFQYSQFFNDDGGLKKVREDFTKLSDDLIVKAKELREKTKIIDISNTQAVTQLTKETQQLTEAKKKQAATLKTIENLEKKDQDQRKKTTKAITAETEALKKRNREARLVANIQNTVTGSIENLRARLALVTVAWSKLSAEELRNTDRGQRLVASKRSLTDQLKVLEKETGDNRREVGNYNIVLTGLREQLLVVNAQMSKLSETELKNTKRGRELTATTARLTNEIKRLEQTTAAGNANLAGFGKSLTGLRSSFVSVAQAAGVTLGLFGAFRVVRSSISIVRDFEKQNATLAGILGQTKEEIVDLTDESKRLGSITVRTATEVAQLQTAYARLGFNQKEIIDLTEATISGSIALNSSLEETSLLVGAVVNSFDDLGTTDAPEIIDQLSKATTLSALNFEKLNVGLPIVASAANALDVPLTEVVATLGKLADSGVETSTAATSLRNIFIESAKEGIDFRDALDRVRKSTDRLKTANELFGKRAAVSALVIANNTENVKELDEALQNAGGSAQELAEKQLDTLDGALKLLISAWEGFVLNLNDATNGGNALATSIRFLAENLTTIIKVITVATTAWIAYNVATRAGALIMKVNAAATTAGAAAQGILTGAVKGSTFAVRAFNLALKANPIGLVTTLLATLVTSYLLFKDSVSEAVKEQQRLNDLQEFAAKREQKNVDARNEERKKEIEALEFEFAKRKANGEDSQKLDEELLKAKKEKNLEEIAGIQETIDKEVEKTREIKAQLEQREKDRIEAFKRAAFSGEELGLPTEANAAQFGLETFDDKRQKQLLKDQIAVIEAENKTRTKNIAELNKEIDALEKNLTIQTKKNLTDRSKEIAILRRKLEDANDRAIADEERREIAIITRKFEREIAAIKGFTQVEINLRKALSEELLTEIGKIEKDFEARRQQQRNEAAEIRRRLTLSEVDLEIANEKEKAKALIKQIIENDQIENNVKKELIAKANAEFLEIERRIILEGELTKLEDQLDIAEANITQRRASFKTEKEFEEFRQVELLKIQRRFLQKRLQIIQQSGVEGFEVEIAQIQAQISDLTAQINALQPNPDPWKEFIEDLKNGFTEAATVIASRLGQAVQESQRALNDQQKAVDAQRERAQQGLANTLAFEQKEQAKREKELIERQKRLDQINRLTAYWNTYNANLASLGPTEDSGDAIIKTLKSIAIVEALTASLTRFGEGGIVEDKLPKDGIFRGPSHNSAKGGIPIMVEGKEGILSANEMSNLGRDNFYKLKQAASFGPIDSNFFTGQKQAFVKEVAARGGYDARVVSELQEVKKAIQSKPSQEINMPEVVGRVLEFTETISEMNMTRRNHYKIQKPRL